MTGISAIADIRKQTFWKKKAEKVEKKIGEGEALRGQKVEKRQARELR